MSRRLATTALACCVLLVPAGCKKPKGIDIDAKQLIPADANAAAGFVLEPLSTSPVGGALATAMRTDKDMGAMMTATRACEVNVDKMHGFLATDLDSDDKIFAVIETPGIGDEDLVRCLEKEIGKATGEDTGLILFETRGDVRITPQQGGGYLIILNKDAVAVVDGPWEDAVLKAIEDPSARTTDSALAAAIKGVDTTSHLWLAASISEQDRAGLEGIPGATAIKAVGASMDVSAGLTLELGLDFLDEAKAGEFREAMPSFFDEIKPELVELGLPPAALDSVTFKGEGARVDSHVEVAGDALPGLMLQLGALMAEP